MWLGLLDGMKGFMGSGMGLGKKGGVILGKLGVGREIRGLGGLGGGLKWG